MEDSKNSKESSAKESGTETFDWVHLPSFPKKLKKSYTKFPLNNWKNIIFFPKELQIHDEGLFYQNTVNKILRDDVFKDFKFYEDKHGAIDFDFKKVYKIDYTQLYKKTILPDFYVYKIESENFFKLVKSREYMMILKNNGNIPSNVKFISILGEIKSSYSSCHIDDAQRLDYEKFISMVNKLETNEYIILMYVYDNSFRFFQNDVMCKAQKESPILYSYVPKLYYEDCYRNYNELIDLLKLKNEKIVIKDKTIFKKKRGELEKENDILTQKVHSLIKENNLLRKQLNENEKSILAQKNNSSAQENNFPPQQLNSSISFILVFIISFIILYLLNNYNLINFHK